jgi:hypothetical protein
MTVKEWYDRLVHPAQIAGLVIDPGAFYDHLRTQAIYSLDRNSTNDVIIWSVPAITWPRGPVQITILAQDVLHEATVLRHAGQDWAIYDGDIVRLNGLPFGLPPECWVQVQGRSNILAAGGHPSLFTGFIMHGTLTVLTDRLIQFMPTDVRAIRRLS